MIKKILTTVLAAVVLTTVAQVASTKEVKAVESEQEYTYFCHRNDSNPNADKPYIKINLDNESYNGHKNHTGPVVTSLVEYSFYKNSKIKWGDIIPPTNDFSGLNWNEGQAVYNSQCEIPRDDNPYEPAHVLFNVICSDDNKEVIVTVANTGDETGNITINDTYFEIPKKSTTEKKYPVGEKLVITIDDKTVYDKTPVCETDTPEVPEVPVVGGRGSGTPTPTPTPTAEALPFTAGVNYMAVLGVISASAVALSLSAKKLYSRFF